ncbi:hypothetical protein ABZ570_03230 [Micromonospora sp. NPDC007271]|uniref:hypothetical protein n=1 Tax=Micromonospora sp. NPDC007271 TaxID=3154587 RepID=UPI0033FDED3C
MSLLPELAVWWIALTAGWIATVSTPSPAELLVGAACGLASAVVASTSRRALGQCWRPDARWLAWLGQLPAAVLVDTVRLLTRVTPRLLAGKEAGGRLVRLAPPSDEPPDRASFRRAWGTFVLSATPASVVVDWPPDGSPVVVHLLGSDGKSMRAAVVR